MSNHKQINYLKAKIKSQKPIIGTWNTLASPLVTEVMAHAGFDFLIIDLEHGPTQISDIHHYVNACERYKCSPIVRVPECSNWMIQQSLDQGAHGIILPGVESGDDIRALVNAVKYHPDGKRGFTPFTKAGGFTNINVENYSTEANNFTLVGVIIESANAINNLDEILKVEGLDIVYFGAYDLSNSMGLSGQVFGEEVISLISAAVKKVTKAGKCPGGFVPLSVNKIKFIIDLGIRFITYNVDSAILYHAISDVLKEVKGE